MKEEFEKWLNAYWPSCEPESIEYAQMALAFQAGYSCRPLRWTTRDGQRMVPEEMETSHIINCIKLLKRKGFVSSKTRLFYDTCPEPQGEMAQLYFEQECQAVMDAPISVFLDRFEEILEERGVNASKYVFE